jgi:hypothetical protein
MLGLIYSLDSAGVVDAFAVLVLIGVVVNAFIVEAFFLLVLLAWILSYISSFRIQSFSASFGCRYQ